ncbi:CPXCG motif-containing cysteine-rich protein [Thermomonas sp.]|uniref:CPXCG motif-containing cysteine-rich protein n=1 Tax=Thermomonas sp. TaxID=1971895 RepID=UPI003D0A03A6
MLDARDVACPYCGEPVTLMLDASAGAQHYIEDCAVCCRPITVVVEVEDDGALALSVYSQDEA